jgi:hypothetical protein
MLERTRVTAYISAAALAAALAGCSSNNNSPTTPTPTPLPTPTAGVIVSQITGGALPAGVVAWVPFTTTEAGSLDATVDWTLASDDIDVYLTQGSCDVNTFGTTACPVLGYSESTTAKPEQAHVASAAAGTYTIFVNNLGPNDESVSYQVVLTSSATGAAPPVASSRASVVTPFQLKGRPRAGIQLK